MARNITTGTATAFGRTVGIFIQVNAALTGSIVVSAAGDTEYGTTSSTIATITNPAVGSSFKYGNLQSVGVVTVTPSTTCDITVTLMDKIT